MNQRTYSPVGPASNLRLWPADDIKMFTIISHTIARMLLLGEPEIPSGVPPTAKCESTKADGIYTHKISYRLAQPSEARLEEYARLSAMPLVVFYLDWAGRERVIGSPSYPARLDIAVNGSGADVSITAKSAWPPLLYKS